MMTQTPLAQLPLNFDISTTPARAESGMQSLQVKEAVPEHLAALGLLDPWRLMASHRAFEALLAQIQSRKTFSVQFRLSESWEPNPRGAGQCLMIVCDLTYFIES